MKQFKTESAFQSFVIEQLKARFSGCIVIKNDPTYIQGIPDLLVLYKDRWAALECKRDGSASHQPNQDYYVAMFDDMSFGEFIYPENVYEVLDELQRSFESAR